MEAVILRLPMVYGPGVRANALRLLQLVDRGWPLPFGRLTNRRSMASLGNVLAATVTALESPATPGQTFFVGDGHDMSTPDLVRVMARALGRPARLARVVRFPVNSSSIARLTESLTVDITKLRRMTGFCPPETVEEGWRATATWYRGCHSKAREGAGS
jgi:UDP-glucose 4-epimerase